MEEDYADIYYVDTRNAVRDHRPGAVAQPRVPFFPGRRPMAPAQTVYLPPTARQPVPMGPAYGQSVPMAPIYGQQPQVIYAPPPLMQTGAASLLGRLTTGQLVETISAVYAALQTLPNSPVATRDTATDVANLILYQGALAQHAKRDEQVRTLGTLVAKLVG